MSGYAERVGKGSLWILGISFMGAIVAYVFRIYLSRTVSVEDFGLFYAVLAFIGLFGFLKELGIGTTLAKRVSEYRASGDYGKIKKSIISAFVVQTVVGIAVFGIIFALAGFFSEAYFQTAAAVIIIQLIAVETIVDVAFLGPVFQGMQRFRDFALIDFSRAVAVLAITFLLLTTGFGVAGVAWAFLLSTVAISSVFTAYLFKKFPNIMKAKTEFDWSHTKGILVFSAPIFIAGVIGSVSSRLDVLMLTWFRPLTEVGWYNVALPTANLMVFFAAPMSATILPTVSEMWTKKEDTIIARGLDIMVKIIFWGAVPAAFVLVSFSDLIIDVLFGPSYLGAAPALQILAVGVVFSALYGILARTILGIGKPEVNMKIAAAAVVSNFVLNAALIPVLGLNGAAIATSASFVITFVLATSYLNRRISIRIPYHDMGKIFAGSLLMWGIISYIKGIFVFESLLEAVIVTVIGAGFYLVFTRYARIITKDDFDLIMKANLRIPTRLRSVARNWLKE